MHQEILKYLDVLLFNRKISKKVSLNQWQAWQKLVLC